jgi:hypothetical protein
MKTVATAFAITLLLHTPALAQSKPDAQDFTLSLAFGLTSAFIPQKHDITLGVCKTLAQKIAALEPSNHYRALCIGKSEEIHVGKEIRTNDAYKPVYKAPAFVNFTWTVQ